MSAYNIVSGVFFLLCGLSALRELAVESFPYSPTPRTKGGTAGAVLVLLSLAWWAFH